MIVTVPPDTLLIECPINPPPDNLEKDSLVKAWNSQTANLGACNNQIEGIKEWKKEVQKEE